MFYIKALCKKKFDQEVHAVYFLCYRHAYIRTLLRKVEGDIKVSVEVIHDFKIFPITVNSTTIFDISIGL